jgi:Mn-dependent DtxR family transcriptional regulator
VRRHRLWESYLVDEAGMAPDHVHAIAERLEHIPVAPAVHASRDPHGRVIPPAG